MLEVFKRNIVRLLRHADYVPLKPAKLAREMGISDEDIPQFKAAFDQLRNEGHVVVGTRQLVSLAPMTGRVVGTFRANPKGFGFVIPREPSGGDLFIPPGSTADALTGDIVAAKVVKKGKREGQMRYSGKIVEILERGQDRFVGTLFNKGGLWLVQPDGTAMTEPVFVDDVTAKNAKAKDKVVVEIITYPKGETAARGVITEVLGKAGQYDAEIKSVIRQYHLAEFFDDQCLEQARMCNADFTGESADFREDITSKVIITIDPADSKDFDDAISLEMDKDGNAVLGVHIADVSHFIESDSPLDVEAHKRGNSVYLPGKTIPMIPEVLSNGICSLQPDQNRFVKSAYLTYDKAGKVIGRRFANSVMRSTQRLNYRQADKALKGHTRGLKPEALKLLKEMEKLSRVIERRRNAEGMIHLDLPEPELVMDASGRVVDAHPADTSYPHTMIEMFMVEANEAVASLLEGLNVPFMRRIHPEPDVMSLKKLAQIVKTFGITIGRTPDRNAIQGLLESVKDKDCSLAVNLLVLRSLAKAEYAPLSMGHYALASKYYCHFTSPIRRQADLLVHRILQLHLEGKLGSAEIPDQQQLTEIGSHLTFTEKQAEDAENELKNVMILQLLSSRLGQELDCVVTGVTTFGVFAQSKQFGIEGLIPTEVLGADKWQFNPKAQSIVGMRSGAIVHLGQSMKVKIVAVNIAARQMNLVPAEPLGGGKKRKTPSKTEKRRRKGRKRRFR